MWTLAAAVLWRTKVPADLRLPQLDPQSVFGADAVRAGIRYERFLDYAWLLGTIVSLAALVVMVRRGPRLAGSLGLGRVNAGLITGVVVTTVLWAVSLPFAFAAAWWERRHGISTEDWGTIIFTPWEGLLATTFGTTIVLAVFLLLAKRYARNWWIGAAAFLLALGFAAQFALPYVSRYGTHPIRAPKLAAAVKQLEAREHAGHPPVRVEKVSDRTTAANAYAIGLGPSSSVFIWDTMLDGRFTTREVRFVIGHELAHLARLHLWKGMAWGILIGIPLLGRGRLRHRTPWRPAQPGHGAACAPDDHRPATCARAVHQRGVAPLRGGGGLGGSDRGRGIPKRLKGCSKGSCEPISRIPTRRPGCTSFSTTIQPALTRVEQAEAFKRLAR